MTDPQVRFLGTARGVLAQEEACGGPHPPYLDAGAGVDVLGAGAVLLGAGTDAAGAGADVLGVGFAAAWAATEWHSRLLFLRLAFDFGPSLPPFARFHLLVFAITRVYSGHAIRVGPLL